MLHCGGDTWIQSPVIHVSLLTTSLTEVPVCPAVPEMEKALGCTETAGWPGAAATVAVLSAQAEYWIPAVTRPCVATISSP